jgi:hypothetical protein
MPTAPAKAPACAKQANEKPARAEVDILETPSMQLTVEENGVYLHLRTTYPFIGVNLPKVQDALLMLNTPECRHAAAKEFRMMATALDGEI